ncbi:MAG: PEP-CTERM-box response regulator transcription factor [Hyphomicrobiales bacterium]|nr:PEP-CTERM-box response regulator transcription factor [Hyphomicrobiales bacterium]
MDKSKKLLIVEDDPGLRSQMRWALQDALENTEVFLAEDRDSALTTLRKEDPNVVVLDLGLPPDPNGATEGLATLESMLSFKPETKVIIASGNEERQNAVKAVSLGAYDFYPKPVDIDVLRLIIERAEQLYELEQENLRLSESQRTSPFDGIIASSPEMLQACLIVERVAKSEVSVLLTGESGTGKEVLAKALHQASDRATGPFIAINCAAIPENLLESELFGHEKGAFTGAVKQTIGKVEQADKGTLFLDEIGDMPLQLQAKLLRFLQERVIERIGGRTQIKVDVRIVSATNKSLQDMIARQTFREDLYYRLDEVGVHIPPLRERQGDAVLLAKFFLQQFSKNLERKIKGFTADALAAINAHAWPGNVRELENKMKRAVVLSDGKMITATDLGLQASEEAPTFPTLKQAREEAEREIVTRALELSDNNVSAAAKLLGVSRPTLYDLMKTFNMRE